MSDLEVKRKMYGDLKQFAKGEMAREIGSRHGRSVRLPWDSAEVEISPAEDDEAAEPAEQAELEGVDPEALQALLDALDNARPR